MAFEGDLSRLPLGDVFQTLAMTRQHGILVVRGAEERRLAVGPRGIALASARPSHGERVARILVARGGVADVLIDKARKAVRRRPNGRIDQWLEEQGEVDPEVLREARRYVAQEDIFNLFQWHEGKFELLEGAEIPPGPFTEMWYDVAGIAMEAARRLDEMPGLDDHVPPSAVLVPTDSANAPTPGTHTEAMCEVYPLADGMHTVAGVVDAYHLGDFDTRKALLALLQAGAVRLATVPEIVSSAKRARTGLVAARLLECAAAMAPDDENVWERLAQAYTDAEEKRAAAAALVQLGQLRLALGKGLPAIETLQRAVRLDPNNGPAHEILTEAHFEQGEIDAGIDSARVSVSACLAVQDFDSAIRVATRALEETPDDLGLRQSLAHGLLGAGYGSDALPHLEEVAAALEASGGDDRKLVEVYRAILSVQRDRKDVARRVEEIIAYAEARRRRVRQRIAIGAGIVILALVAVPLAFYRSAQDQLDSARAMIDAGDHAAAQELLFELDVAELEEEQLIVLRNMMGEIGRRDDKPQLGAIRGDLFSKLETIYAAADENIEAHRLAEGLEKLEDAVELIHGKPGHALRAVSADEFERFVLQLSQEAQSALQDVESKCASLASWSASVADRFRTSEAHKRAEFTVEPGDLSALEALVNDADAVRAVANGTDWDDLKLSVGNLIARARPANATARAKIVDSVDSLLESSARVAQDAERGLAFAHRAKLLTGFRDARRDASEKLLAGRVEDAIELYEEYVTFCNDVRAAEHGETYRQIVDRYMDTLPLEELHGETLQRLKDVLVREADAEKALERDDVERAFRIRADLVRAEPSINFASRFALPLELRTRPAGTMVILHTDEGQRRVGLTPVVIDYPVSGATRISLRHDGFEETMIERNGALEDEHGSVRVDLRKLPAWSVETNATTTAAATDAGDALVLADRRGWVRRLSREDGTELASVDTKLIGGFAGAPIVHAGRVFVGSVDAVLLVLNGETLDELERIPLAGAVRAGLLTTPHGVFVTDDAGSTRVVTAEGRTRWEQRHGNVAVDPAISGEGVVLVTTSGELRIVNSASGELVRRLQLPGQAGWGPPLIDGRTAYLGSATGDLVAVDLVLARVQWTAPLGERITGRPALLGTRLAVGTGNQNVHLVDVESGLGVASLALPQPIADGVVAVEDGFVAVGENGHIGRLDREGVLHWQIDLDESVNARPQVAAGSVVIVTRQGRVVVIKP